VEHVNQTALQRQNADDRYIRKLAETRDAFPGWEIRETHLGLIAVPAGSQVISAVTIDALVIKLRCLG
jgi:hypothetical protein